VGWRLEFDDKGRPTKRPYNPRTDSFASVTNRETWSDFDTARRACIARRLDGLGHVLTKDQGIVFIDLDHCVNGNGEIAPWAYDVLELMQSFAEQSPSGDGIHILIFASLPDDAKHTQAMGEDGRSKIEIYGDRRYFTVTGVRLQGYRDENPLAIEPRQRELDELYAKLFPPPTNSEKKGTGAHRPSSPLADRELIDRAMAAANGDKFRRLWSGDTSDYHGDDSRADLALASMLAFWTGKDSSRMVALFEQSGLVRDKEGSPGLSRAHHR
jgi:primase-polymerase (primpol)-like protein